LSNVSPEEALEAEREMEAISYSRLTDNISRRINSAINKLYNRDDFDVVNHLASLYKNGDRSVIRADIMTALYRSGVSSIGDLFKLTAQFMDGVSGGDRYTDTLMEPYKMYPMTSVNGKAYPYIGQWSSYKGPGMRGGGVTMPRETAEIEPEQEIEEDRGERRNKHAKRSIKELAANDDAFDDSVFY
jgi:hypothetical protein